ncbi:MAG: response regulator transcription factor [Thermodesulfovibrionales bacterium]|nr:response regulator transcription factor [Thermodesulfovibrionales bacterium]
MKILLIEDDKNISSFIKKGLEEEYYSVDIADNSTEGFNMAISYEYDIIILDIMLPGKIDGITLCKKLRETGIKIPILMLTALDTIDNKVEGLESGADDYMTKPFAFAELLARVKSLSRRSYNFVHQLSIADLSMDLLSRRVFRGNKEIILSPKEFSILEYLLKNKERVLSRTQIIEKIWGYNYYPETNIVDVHIKFLRDKIDNGFEPKLIHTVRGSGYILKAENGKQA